MMAPALGRAVLNDDDGSGRRSRAMNVDTPPVFAVVALSCASARKLFFSSARRGWGSERGRGLAVRGLSLLLRRKNGILILGRV